MRRWGWELLILLYSLTSPAQELPEMESQAESDEVAELCQYLQDNPIDLYRTTPEELLLIPWLSPRQALEVHAYLKTRKIDDPYRLVADSIIDEKTLAAILPFIYIRGKVSPGNVLMASSLWQNRWSAGEPPGPYPWQHRQRIDYRRGKEWRMFLQSQKDLGERDWLDYYSGALKWQSRSANFTVIVGDFRLCSGAGLAWGWGMAKFLYPGVMFRPAKPARIDIHTSSNEWSALRGLAVNRRFGNLSVLLAGSFRHQDGKVDSLGVLQYIYTDGYHRTPAELARKRVMAERLGVAGLGWDRGDIWLECLGHFSKRRPSFNQDSRVGLTISGGIHRGPGSISWEVFSHDRDRQAFCLVASAGSVNSETSLLAYAYEPGVILPRPGGYEYYDGGDEQGAAVVQKLKLPHRTDLSGLCHWFRPWSSPTVLKKGWGGYRLDFKLVNGIIKGVEIGYRFRLYDRERIIAHNEGQSLGREISHLHQIGVAWRLRELIKMSLGLSISRFRPPEGGKPESGELLSAGLTWQPRQFVSMSARSSVFYIESYDARIYQTEPELRSSSSFHGHWGQGRRDAVLVRFRFYNRIWAEGKVAYATRHYRNETDRELELGLQVECKI